MKKTDKGVLKKVYGYFFQEAWKMHKGYFAVRVAKLLISSLLPFLSIYFIPAIIAELMGGREMEKLLRLVVIMIVLDFLLNIMNGTFGNIIERYGLKFENHFEKMLSKRIMELDFQLTEDKNALDQLQLAKNGMNWYSGGLNGLMDSFFGVFSNIITLLGVSALILMKAPAVLLVAGAVVIMAASIQLRLNVIEQEGYKKLSKINRVFGYLGWSLVDFRYGKDIRLYGSKNMMIGKWIKFTEDWNDRQKDIADKQLPLRLCKEGTQVLHDLAIYFYLGFIAIAGKISVATCIQMINSAGTFTNSLNGIMFNYLEMVKKSNYANEFIRFMDYPAAMSKGCISVKEGKHTFEFKNVSFAYPGSEAEVLKNVNLKIHEGEHLSIVGLNGAGKTTMIKLLCRLYDPTQGEILMDGVHIGEYEYEDYMKVFAPVFQDFKLFAFTIKENLLLKSTAAQEEEEMVKQVLHKAGIDEKIESFPNDINTVLFKQFEEEGIEPSGGEQQKIAIARALFKDAPVVILDEPTAALDPIAEYEIYRQFENLVFGKTAIYISHRLSSCQFCDKIAVFSEGCVKEYGTHDELVDKPDGIYAEMFAAQAQYYVS